jgi:adenylosuccinate lyase
MLAFEVALARASARAGIIPGAAVETIETACGGVFDIKATVL